MDHCPKCESKIPSGLMECPECGYRFSFFHILIDRFGGSIQSLFAIIYRFFGGEKHDKIASVFGFIGVMLYVVAVVLAILIPCAVFYSFITGNSVSVIEALTAIVHELIVLTWIIRLIAYYKENRKE